MNRQYKARAFAHMLVQRFGKGVAILMALVLSAIPIRFLSVLALAVITIWAGFGLYAGRRFDELTAPDDDAPPQGPGGLRGTGRP